MKELSKLLAQLALVNQNWLDVTRMLSQANERFGQNSNAPLAVETRALYSNVYRQKCQLEGKIRFLRGRESMYTRGYQGVFSSKLQDALGS